MSPYSLRVTNSRLSLAMHFLKYLISFVNDSLNKSYWLKLSLISGLTCYTMGSSLNLRKSMYETERTSGIVVGLKFFNERSLLNIYTALSFSWKRLIHISSSVTPYVTTTLLGLWLKIRFSTTLRMWVDCYAIMLV